MKKLILLLISFTLFNVSYAKTSKLKMEKASKSMVQKKLRKEMRKQFKTSNLMGRVTPGGFLMATGLSMYGGYTLVDTGCSNTEYSRPNVLHCALGLLAFSALPLAVLIDFGLIPFSLAYQLGRD